MEADPNQSKRMRYFKPMAVWACLWTAISFGESYIPSPWIYIGVVPAVLTIWYGWQYFRAFSKYPPPRKPEAK